MPRLQINSKGPITLTALVHILGSVIEHLEHRRQTRRLAICALDRRIASPNVVNRQTDASSPLGDLRTLSQRIVDALDGIVLHVNQKAGAQLGVRGARVEQGRRSVDEIPQRQCVIGLLNLQATIVMKLDGHSHPHVLGTLPYTTVTTTEQVALLQRLVAEVVKYKVPSVVNHRLQTKILRNQVMRLRDNALVKKNLCNIHQATRRILLMIVNHKTRGQLAIIGVVTGLHHGARLCRKLVQLRSLDPILNLITHLLCDQIRVDMRQPLGKTLDASQHLVEGNRDTIAVALCDVHMVRHLGYCTKHPYL